MEIDQQDPAAALALHRDMARASSDTTYTVHQLLASGHEGAKHHVAQRRGMRNGWLPRGEYISTIT